MLATQRRWIPPRSGSLIHRGVTRHLWATHRLSCNPFAPCGLPERVAQARARPQLQRPGPNLPGSAEAAGRRRRAPRPGTRPNWLPACPFGSCLIPSPVVKASAPREAEETEPCCKRNLTHGTAWPPAGFAGGHIYGSAPSPGSTLPSLTRDWAAGARPLSSLTPASTQASL